MFKYVEITNDNIELASKIQLKIFPGESAYIHYKDAIKSNLEYYKYYLVYENDTIVGITGLYSHENINDTNSIWLGWFGVLKEFRNKGYGRHILLDTINMATILAEKYPIRYFRLYTSEKDNITAVHLYRKIMDIEEKYNNPDDVNYDNNCIIFSKALSENPITYWNNRFMNLKEIIAQQDFSNIEVFK